jgi:acyl-CoA synthetase (AMP-forming)/AMP-acid ligase II
MIFRAPEPPLPIPETPLTPFLLESAEGRGDKPALIDGPSGRTLTYGGWAEGMRRTAAGLHARGFGKGDVFAIYSPNLPEYAIAFHAVSLLGGIVTTVNPLYTVNELAQQLQDCRARLIVTVPPCVEKAREAAQAAGLEEVFVFGEAEGAQPFASIHSAGEPPAVAIDPRRDVVALPYSSGTTGLPKGVMLTHYNLVANIIQSSSILSVGEDDVTLGVLPFFHIYGMVVIMNVGLHVGSTIVTMPRFDLEQFLATVQKYKVTFVNVVPPIVLAMAKHPLVEKYDLSRLRMMFSGAAPLGEKGAGAASARLGCTVVQGYGLTETSPVTHATRAEQPGIKVAGIGPPLPNTEAKIVDVSTGAELGPGQEGEVCIRGPQVMTGYLNRPDATRAMIDAEGWLHTGDVGYADEDGCFFIVDRVKELIKYKGLQIAPAELEAVLLAHDGVADAAVIPVPDEEAGEVPKAFVVLKPGTTPDDVCAFVAARVAPYKKLRHIEVTEQIPKSPSGKILRRLLVEKERAKRA